MIYCFSQHHTGTWTSLTWLNQHRDIKGFMQEAHVYETFQGDLVVHQVESGEYRERFHPNMVYHEHINRDARSDISPRLQASQMVMMATHATLIPIRDPLASLVTYQRWADRDGRSKDGVSAVFSPRVFVDVWCALAKSWEVLQRFGHVRFICWDLLAEEKYPGARLWEHAQALGLKDRRPSRAWNKAPIHDNTAGDYELKRAYLNQQTTRLRKGIDENGYNYLVNKGLQLRPFLEHLGYRNLQWWS